MPTRVRKPKDKVTVENTVKQLTTYLYCSLVILPYQKLRNDSYNSIEKIFLYFRHSTELLRYRLAYAYVTLYILVRACETTQFIFEGERHETSLFQP